MDALKQVKSKGRNKRENILNILNNIESSLFEGVYYHYKNVSKKTGYERSISEGKQINNKLFNYYFRYSTQSNRMNRLGDVKGDQNKDQVYFINKQLTKIKKIVKNVHEDRRSKIEEDEKIIDIIERILDLNNENQLGERLKILTPDQMLSILPITLA